jgi:hypothetical protein
MLSSTSYASQESRSTPPKDLTSEGKATLPREAHLEITLAPSDHGSSASVDEAALLGRKRSFAEAMGADEGSQARLPAPTPGVSTRTLGLVLSTRWLSVVPAANTYSVFGPDLRSKSSQKRATCDGTAS